jgi:hypothetical protein
LTVEKNGGMPENYRFMMDYEYQEKKKEIYYLKYTVFEIYILCIRFHNIFFVCEYQLYGQLHSRSSIWVSVTRVYKRVHKYAATCLPACLSLHFYSFIRLGSHIPLA